MKGRFTMAFAMMVMVVLMVAGAAQAAPYFRLLDPKHPVINGGMSFDNKGVSRPTSMVAIIEHHAADGYFFIPGVNWTPLAVGGGFQNKQFHLAVGPSFNTLPMIQAGLLSFLDAITPADKYQNLKALLKPGALVNGDLVGCLGVNAEYDITGGKVTTPLFAGASWKF